MPRYIQTADKAADILDNIMSHLKDHPEKDMLLAQITYLFNLGIRISPRGVQSTVRLNAVKQAVKNQAVKVSMQEKEFTNRFGKKDSYNAINIVVSPTVKVADGESDENE